MTSTPATREEAPAPRSGLTQRENKTSDEVTDPTEAELAPGVGSGPRPDPERVDAPRHLSEPLGVAAPDLAASSSRRWGLSIGHKLGLLICGLQLAIVGCLAWYFENQQIDSLRNELESKADTYAQLVAAQVRSAVAFEDRETAREVFDAVSSDPDLLAAVLFDQSGRSLHIWGTPGSMAQRANGGVDARKVFELSDRFLAVAPVLSLEGPRGTLTLEFTKAQLVQSRAELTRAAALAGGIALLFGSGIALLIARSFARRLRAISVVAEKIAGGDLSQEAVCDLARDEVGSLARSFAAMLEQIKRLFSQIQQRAAEEQTRLEQLVRERTSALEERNMDMRRVMDNVDQGFLTIDRQGNMSIERSAIIERWLGPPPPSALLWNYVDQAAPGLSDRFAMSWEQVLDDCLPMNLALDQMPQRFSAAGRHFSIGYKPILGPDGHLERAVVVLSDITPVVERERVEAEQREALRLFSRVSEDRAGVLEFFAEAQRLVEQITQATPDDPRTTKRLLHTLKGNAAMFGLERLSSLCHAIEDVMEDSNANIADAERRRLLHGWTEMYDQLSPLTGDSTSGGLSIGDDDYRQLLLTIESGCNQATLRSLVEGWRLESTEVRLKRAARQAMALAERLGKPPLEVRIESNELRLDPKIWREVWAEFPHLIRNAIDHGFERLDARASGLPTVATLCLRTFMDASKFVIEVEDSGRGVNWGRVRELAQARGLPTATQADLERALFIDGLSTKERVDETSGRGVGMAAIAAAVQARGGRIEVHSKAPHGTRVRLSWPSSVAEARPKNEALAQPAK